MSFRTTDPVLRALRRKIEEYRFSTFRLSTFSISVSIAREEIRWRGAVSPPAGVKYGLYIFHISGKDDQTKLIKLDQDGVWIKIRRDDFIPLFDYLKRQPLGPDPSTYSRDFQIEAHTLWWRQNGKKFRLLDLPGEIRSMIYRQAIGPYVEPYPSARHRPVRVRTHLNTALLHVNRQVCNEYQSVLYNETLFYLQHWSLFQRLLRNPQLPIMQLRRLKLAFSHVAFLKLFGCHLVYESGRFEVSYDPSPEAALIKTMHLKDLILYIEHPANRADAPWTNGCQRIMVDWILDAAWPFVEGLPVHIEGHITSEQKKTFEAKAHVAWKLMDNLREDEDGGHGNMDEDEDTEEGGVSLAASDLKPDQSATKPCGFPDCEVVMAPRFVTLPPPCGCKINCQSNTSWTSVQ